MSDAGTSVAQHGAGALDAGFVLQWPEWLPIAFVYACCCIVIGFAVNVAWGILCFLNFPWCFVTVAARFEVGIVWWESLKPKSLNPEPSKGAQKTQGSLKRNNPVSLKLKPWTLKIKPWTHKRRPSRWRPQTRDSWARPNIILAFFWLALRTSPFWVSIWTIIRRLKSLTFRRGSEVSQVMLSIGLG